MIIKELPENAKFMSLGSNCIFTCLQDRIRGPLDNILQLNVTALDYLFQGKYLKEFLNIKNVSIIELDGKTIFEINKLELLIRHNDYSSLKYKKEHIRRVSTFYDFLKNLQVDSSSYFLIYCPIGAEEVTKEILIKYNIMDKTIVFANKDLFTNTILINYNYLEKEISFLAEEISKYFTEKDYNFSPTFGWKEDKSQKDESF